MKNNIKIAAICPLVSLADTKTNTKNIIKLSKLAVKQGAQFITTPELAITGATCGDLFLNPLLLESALKSLNTILKETKKFNAVLIVGLPLQVETQLVNVSAILHKGKILALVPAENCDTHYFTPAQNLKYNGASVFGKLVPFSPPTFKAFNTTFAVKTGFDINETFPLMPKAEIIFNPSANYEYLGKQEKLENSLLITSAMQKCTYVYASSAFGESSAEAVYSANILIYKNGKLLAKCPRFTTKEQITVCDINKNGIKDFALKNLKIDKKHPFSPVNKQELLEVLELQALALARRLEQTKINKVVLGISGGLDSSLALLAAVHTFKKLNLPLKNIFAYTLPGLGTTKKTKNNAELLCKALGVSFEEIDIKPAVLQHFKDIKHNRNIIDTAYENAQARERTQILFDISNKIGALVLGTGDMSELALGWATYGGDHLSMYGLNAGIPKTLIQEIVAEYAKTAPAKISKVLKDILATPISPELKPASKGKITQKTEDLVGPYILHDFFLYHFLVNNYGPKEIYKIACQTFKNDFKKAEIKHWLEVFFRRFFTQQFKRSCSPEGPKILTVSLSPRTDLRLPSDVSSALWLEKIKKLK